MVTPRHPDKSLCGHDQTPCPGRFDLVATCACGWQTTGLTTTRLNRFHAAHVAEKEARRG